MSSTTALSTIAALIDGPKTAQDAGTNAVYLARAEQQGLVKRVGQVHTGRRGRPAHIWRLTDKGRKRVKRAQAREAQSAQPVAA